MKRLIMVVLVMMVVIEDLSTFDVQVRGRLAGICQETLQKGIGVRIV